MIILIPIKKNSKRLKNKNFLLLKNKPLFKWTTDFAKKHFKKEKILISTDCKNTAKILEKEGFQVPFIRPKHLASQSATMFSVAKHAINFFENKFNKAIEKIILLQPTTPYRSISDIKNGIKLFNKNLKPTISVTKLHVKSDKIYLKNKNLISQFNNREKIAFIPNGSFYIVTKKQLFINKNFYFKKMNFVEVTDIKKKVDIDYLQDLNLANKL